MRTLKHLTPRYISNRVFELYYERRNPDLPWLTKEANKLLPSLLLHTDVGLEFGSGRSTLWFSKHVQFLTSVEHDEKWSEIVKGKVLERKINNIDYRVFSKGEAAGESLGNKAEYAAVANEFDENSLDFCVVDGIYREACVLAVLDKIKPGGFLLIDNVNRYLPSESLSPSSRSVKDGALNAGWEKVENKLNAWRKIWTSSGVTDTAIYIKPYSE